MTTTQHSMPDRERSSTEETDTAPSMFSPIDNSSMPDMFDTESDYQDR